MPVWPRRGKKVVHQAGGEATRTEGAARVEVDRCLERNEAEAAHTKPRGDGEFKKQRVGPGACGESMLACIHGFPPCRPPDTALSCAFAKGLLARPSSRSLAARLDLIDTTLDASTHELLKSEAHARSATLGAAKKRAGNLGT